MNVLIRVLNYGKAVIIPHNRTPQPTTIISNLISATVDTVATVVLMGNCKSLYENGFTTETSYKLLFACGHFAMRYYDFRFGGKNSPQASQQAKTSIADKIIPLSPTEPQVTPPLQALTKTSLRSKTIACIGSVAIGILNPLVPHIYGLSLWYLTRPHSQMPFFISLLVIGMGPLYQQNSRGEVILTLIKPRQSKLNII